MWCLVLYMHAHGAAEEAGRSTPGFTRRIRQNLACTHTRSAQKGPFAYCPPLACVGRRADQAAAREAIHKVGPVAYGGGLHDVICRNEKGIGESVSWLVGRLARPAGYSSVRKYVVAVSVVFSDGNRKLGG